MRDKRRIPVLLRQAMKRGPLTAQQMADLAGVTRQQYYRWLSAENRPGHDALASLGSALEDAYAHAGVTTTDLLTAADYSDPRLPTLDSQQQGDDEAPVHYREEWARDIWRIGRRAGWTDDEIDRAITSVHVALSLDDRRAG